MGVPGTGRGGEAGGWCLQNIKFQLSGGTSSRDGATALCLQLTKGRKKRKSTAPTEREKTFWRRRLCLSWEDGGVTPLFLA